MDSRQDAGGHAPGPADPAQLMLATGIREEDVAESAPRVRALVVQRLEMIWRACEPSINLPQEHLDEGRRPDPRFVDAGIRVTDRLVQLYQLTKPQHAMSEPDPASRTDQRELAKAKVAELEARLQDKRQ